MSGIVGIFEKKGTRVERALVHALTQSLAFRGPDGRQVWTDGPVGFGHTMLRTTRESLMERQPANLEGFWITADARLDRRDELQKELEKEARKVERAAPDSELILHAYAAWGEECVQRLRGDFAFAIWDARRQILFCARDHFGVKPFYYAETPDFFLFSNTLNCVRLHPNVSDDLSEAALADFLLFGLNCDTATTTFRAIRRLPPAHCLTVSADELRIERYWTAPTNGRIRYRHSDEYVEHFQLLLQAAVADRMRADRVGILLSGGLDSGAIAATARELSSKTMDAVNLRAYTVVYESLISDRDGSYARATAKFLAIPIQCIALDDLPLFDRWDDPERAWPEPVDDPLLAGLFDQFGMIARDCRAVLSGDGSDNLMHFQMLPYAKDVLRRRQWRRAISEFPMYIRMRPSLVPGIRRRIKGVFARDAGEAVFPRWLAPDFVRRTNLAERWKERNRLSTLPSHPVLPKGHASLDIPQWPHLFEHEDPGVTRCAVEVRNPFLDLRIVEYLLALPPFPWFFEKMLVREAMVGRLPETVRLRPKTPMELDPLAARLNQQGTEWLDQVCWERELSQYVSTSALLPLARRANAEQTLSCMRPVCLNFWLQSSRRVRYNLHAEASNG